MSHNYYPRYLHYLISKYCQDISYSFPGRWGKPPREHTLTNTPFLIKSFHAIFFYQYANPNHRLTYKHILSDKMPHLFLARIPLLNKPRNEPATLQQIVDTLNHKDH